MQDNGMDSDTQPKQLGAVWAYSRSAGWEQLDADPLAEFEAGTGGRWDEQLKAAGYDVVRGDDVDLESVAIHEAAKGTSVTRRFEFVVEVSLNQDSLRTVFVSDLPSLIELFPSLMGARTALRFEAFAHKLEQIAERLFRAQHGHDYWHVCQQCDPHEWERQQEAMRARQAAKRAGGGARR